MIAGAQPLECTHEVHAREPAIAQRRKRGGVDPQLLPGGHTHVARGTTARQLAGVPAADNQRGIDEHMAPSGQSDAHVQEGIRGHAFRHRLVTHRRLDRRTAQQHVRGRYRPAGTEHRFGRTNLDARATMITRRVPLPVDIPRGAAERDPGVLIVDEHPEQALDERRRIVVVVVEEADDLATAQGNGSGEPAADLQAVCRAVIAEAGIRERVGHVLEVASIVVHDEFEVTVGLGEHAADRYPGPAWPSPRPCST